MEYVVKSERLKNYLYYLGFNCRQVADKTGHKKYVYLFQNDEDVQRAIEFYTTMKNKLKN